MLFNSSPFLVFFVAFFLVYTIGGVSPRAKAVLLIVGSLAFYATLSLRFLPLLVGVGVFNFYLASAVHRESVEPRRTHLLHLGVGANVLMLAFFKFAVPTVGSGVNLFAQLGLHPSPRLIGAVMPLGASFYTLQAISYLVDVHRRVYEPPRSIVWFFASFTLFPHLLSGPIVRSAFLIPQLERASVVRWEVVKRGLLVFTAGVVKKAIADRLAPTADAAFDSAGAMSLLQSWTGLLAYAGQLYADFSGYTDMATGLALLLGIELPPNFNLPYLATSPVDFWRRWHISLSSWLRDYVHLPLGVRFRTHRYSNIVLTWVVAGLWHGASWLFLLYGLYHGVLLAMTDWISRWRLNRQPIVPENSDSSTWEDPPTRGFERLGGMALTFYLVLMGYVLFRARSLGAAWRFLAALHTSRAASVVSRTALMTLGASLAAILFCHLVDYAILHKHAMIERPWVLWPALFVAMTCVMLFGVAEHTFIYFAF